MLVKHWSNTHTRAGFWPHRQFRWADPDKHYSNTNTVQTLVKRWSNTSRSSAAAASRRLASAAAAAAAAASAAAVALSRSTGCKDQIPGTSAAAKTAKYCGRCKDASAAVKMVKYCGPSPCRARRGESVKVRVFIGVKTWSNTGQTRVKHISPRTQTLRVFTGEKTRTECNAILQRQSHLFSVEDFTDVSVKIGATRWLD
jgi:hypothetical protein